MQVYALNLNAFWPATTSTPQDPLKPTQDCLRGRFYALCPVLFVPVRNLSFRDSNSISTRVRGGASTTLTNGTGKHHNSYRWTERLLLWPKASPMVAAVIVAVAIPSKPALMKPRNSSVSKDAAPAVAKKSRGPFEAKPEKVQRLHRLSRRQ